MYILTGHFISISLLVQVLLLLPSCRYDLDICGYFVSFFGPFSVNPRGGHVWGNPSRSEVSEMAIFMPNSNSKWPFFFILKCGLNFSRSSWQWLVALMSSWTGVSNYRFLDFFFRAAVVYIILDHKSRCKVSQQHSKRDRGLNYRVCSHVFHLCVTFSYIWALNDNKYLGSSYLDFIQHLWFNNYSECSQFRKHTVPCTLFWTSLENVLLV